MRDNRDTGGNRDPETSHRRRHPSKRGRITGRSPAVLGHLGVDADQWVKGVRAVNPEGGFCRAVGSEAALLDKAAAIGQRWLRGLGIARSLANGTGETGILGAAGAWGRWACVGLGREKPILREDQAGWRRRSSAGSFRVSPLLRSRGLGIARSLAN
jgi:hypothetical protein